MMGIEDTYQKMLELGGYWSASNLAPHLDLATTSVAKHLTNLTKRGLLYGKYHAIKHKYYHRDQLLFKAIPE